MMDLFKIIDGVQKILDSSTSNDVRNYLFQITERYKESEFVLDHLQVLCAETQQPAVILFGLRCLNRKVRRSWVDLLPNEKQSIKECLSIFITNIQRIKCTDSESNALCLILTQTLVHLIKCEWPQQWPTMITELIALGQTGPIQSLIVFDTFLRLSEDILFFQDVPVVRRRELCTSLSDNVQQIICYALNSIVLAVEASSNTFFQDDLKLIRAMRAALILISGLLEWCNIQPFIEWKSQKDIGSRLQTVPSIQLILYLISVPGIRMYAADILCVLFAKKSLSINSKTSEMHPVYSYLIAFTSDPNMDPVSFLLDTTRTMCSVTEYTEESLQFMIRWAHVISLCGIHTVENWTAIENKSMASQVNSIERFEMILRSNALMSAHPTRLFSSSAKFFKAILESEHSALLDLLSNHLDSLLTLWTDHIVIRPYPVAGEQFACWIYAKVEKDEYVRFLQEMRTDIKNSCLALVAAIWPVPVIQHLLDWHTKLFRQNFGPEDFIIPSQPYVNPASPLARQWEALSFSTDKIISNAVLGQVGGLSKDLPNVASLETRSKAMDLISSYLMTNASTLIDGGDGVALPADPGIRTYYLSVLDHLIIPLEGKNGEFILKLLMQHFASLRYNPSLKSTGEDCPVPISKMVNMRCPVVKEMHMMMAVNIFRITRAHYACLLPFFDSFCSELNDIWNKKPCGQSEQCMLLEVVVFLALRLPCSFTEQQVKLKAVLSSIFSEWTNPDSNILKLSTNGVSFLIDYFGLNQDIHMVNANKELIYERVGARIKVQMIVAATISVVRRLRHCLSAEQMEQVCIPLIEPIISPVFQLIKTLNELWQPVTMELVHPSMLAFLQPTDNEKAMVKGTHTFKNKLKFEPKDMLIIDSSVGENMSRLHVFLSTLNENMLLLCQLLIDASSSRFYALSSEQLSQLLYNYVCADIQTLPDYRVLCILRHVIVPYVRHCPAANIENALITIMPYILDCLFQKIHQSWSVVKIVNKEEVDEDEASEEIFQEETVRALSLNLIELTRALLAFTGAKPYKYSMDEPMNKDEPIAEGENEDMVTADESTVAVIELGVVASALFPSTNGVVDVVGNDLESSAFVRVTSWLIAAITWPDSRVCGKAANLLIKILQFVLKKDLSGASSHLSLSPDLAKNLLIGGLKALRSNGQFQTECLNPLLTFLSRVYTSVGEVSACEHLNPILLSALGSCQENGYCDTDTNNIEAFTRLLYSSPKVPSDRVKKDLLKKLLQPIIGIPVSEQFREHLSISTLEPLRRPNLRRQKKATAAEQIEQRSHLTLQALSDLFSSAD